MRAATLARLALGGACLARPREVLQGIGGLDRDDRRTRTIVRVLGGRLVGQGACDLALGPRTRRFDVAVDLTHAASMVAAARRWPTHRRSALVSAGLATGIALLDARPGPAG